MESRTDTIVENRMDNSGKQDGYNSGKQDGFTEGKCEIIHLMFDAGESLEKIAQYTGYKVEELKNLLKK